MDFYNVHDMHVEKVSATFFWVLSNAFHNRIDYPGFDFNRRRAE